MIENFEGFYDSDINREFNSKHVTKTSKLGSINRKIVRAKKKNEIHRKVSATETKLPVTKEEEEYEEEKKDSNIIETVNVSEQREYKEVNLTDVPCVLTSQSLIHPPLTMKPETASVKYASVDLEESSSVDALNKFEETRKKLEAFNLERKEQLKQALSDRAKKTKEEVKRLNAIEEELKKLDSCVSSDVSILRNQIETASHDFMEAQKRFNKAEREYVEAKMELFSKKEKKELLTSHLCSIIEQNELRKAKKLSDLMEKLEVPSKPTSKEVPSRQEDKGDKKAEVKDSS